MTMTKVKPVRVQLRLSGDEADQLDRLARRLGVTKTQAVRQAVATMLGEPVPGDPATVAVGTGEKALRFQIGRVRSNLDQLDRRVPGLRTMPANGGTATFDLMAHAAKWESQALRHWTDEAARTELAGRVRDEIGRPVAELLMKANGGEPVEAAQVWAVSGARWRRWMRDLTSQ